MPFEPPAWRLTHEHWLESVGHQKQRIRHALAVEVGDEFESLVTAIADRLIVISARLHPDGLWYTASLRLSDGLAPTARVHASRLGPDDLETLSAEAKCAHLQQLAHQPAPDDASSLQDSPPDLVAWPSGCSRSPAPGPRHDLPAGLKHRRLGVELGVEGTDRFLRTQS